MRAESVAKSIRMLKGILDGKTYVAVAQESGLSRSAVEQRVKALARDLQTVVGVEWVDEDEVPTIKGMRARKDNYLEALEHYQPAACWQRRQGGTRVDQRGRRACRGDDPAAQQLQEQGCGLAAGTVRDSGQAIWKSPGSKCGDYLTEDGSVREESVMRADAAINGKARPLFFASTKVVAAVDAYLEERVRRGQGTTKSTKYRGLDPDSGLFLTRAGHDMPINIRAVGNRKHHLCDAIRYIYRKIFARAGLKDVSALCARRTVAKKLTERGCDLNQIAEVLGLTERDAVLNLMPNERESLKAVVRELV